MPVAVSNGGNFLFEVLTGRLSLVCMYYDEQAYDIWVMKVYGVKESWTKPFTLR